MNCWVIDSQSNSGPDYCYRSILVIIAPDDRTANEMFLDEINYPVEDEDEYLDMSTEELGELVFDDDPEENYTGDGWVTQCNQVLTYSDVPSNEASIKQFDIQIECSDAIEFYEGTKKTLLELDQFYKKKIGQDSPYSFSDFVDDFFSFLEEDEIPDYLIDGVSMEVLLDVMKKRGII
jgi:hypothetical protein